MGSLTKYYHLNMKTIIATFALAFTGLVATAQKNLVAEVYPGAVMMNTSVESLILTRNSGYSTANAEAYLVKDAKARVVAFYQKKAKKIMPCENGDQYLEMQTQQTIEYGIMSAGVVISSNPYKKTTYEEIGGFDELRELVKLNFHTEDEFNKIYEKYKHLNHAFFNTTAEEDKVCGDLLNLQEQLYNKYTKKAKPVGMDDDLEPIIARIEKLTEEGKYEEAYDLTVRLRNHTEKAVSDAQPVDTWGLWLEYFDILEKNAFKSMIIIHKPIAQWHIESEAMVSQN
jgi:hypothetical protein